MGPNLFVDIFLHHSSAIALIERRRVADHFLNEECDESGNGACRRIMHTVAHCATGVYIVLAWFAIGIGAWFATSASNILELLIQSQCFAML